MNPFRTILAATDFSAAGHHAVRRAALLASQQSARLALVHVVDPAPLVRARDWLWPVDAIGAAASARVKLCVLAAELMARDGVAATVDVRTGDVVEELHRAAAQADLLVIGHRRRNFLAKLVLGKTAQRLIEECRRPVLVVKQRVRGRYGRAVASIGLTPRSGAAAAVAASLVPGVDLHVFHAVDLSDDARRAAETRASIASDSRARQEAGIVARLRRTVARFGLDARRVAFTLGNGSATKATSRHARSVGADLLVTSVRRRAGVNRTELDEVGDLLAGSHCDVLIVQGMPGEWHLRSASPWRGVHAAGRDAARFAPNHSITAPWRPQVDLRRPI